MKSLIRKILKIFQMKWNLVRKKNRLILLCSYRRRIRSSIFSFSIKNLNHLSLSAWKLPLIRFSLTLFFDWLCFLETRYIGQRSNIIKIVIKICQDYLKSCQDISFAFLDKIIPRYYQDASWNVGVSNYCQDVSSFARDAKIMHVLSRYIKFRSTQRTRKINNWTWS